MKDTVTSVYTLNQFPEDYSYSPPIITNILSVVIVSPFTCSLWIQQDFQQIGNVTVGTHLILALQKTISKWLQVHEAFGFFQFCCKDPLHWV